MKIAVSMLEDISQTDGYTVRVRRVVDLIRKKHDVTLITWGSDENQKLEDIEGIRIISVNVRKELLKSKWVPIRSVPFILWNLRLIPIILRNNFNLFYCSQDLYGFMIYIFSKIHRYKIVFEAQFVPSEEKKQFRPLWIEVKLRQTVERFIAKHADHVIALSENIFGYYQAYNKNIDLVPVFVDEDIFKRKDYIKKDLKLIGLLGPFDTCNNIHFLEYLYSNIKYFDDEIKFIVIGRCQTGIKNERVKYTGYINSLEDYVNQLSLLDAVIIPSNVATSGPLNKIIEPMSCSLPVFTTPKGMVGLYYVEPGEDILVFEENEIVGKVNELIFKENLMEKIGKNARIVVEKYYSKKANEEKLLMILESFVGEAK